MVMQNKVYNKYWIIGNICYIYLVGSMDVAVVDSDDYDKVKEYTWWKNNDGYIMCNTEKVGIHNIVMDITKHSFNAEVDHINRNKWDNRKCNLRVVDRQINNLNRNKNKNNTSGYKGVAWHSQNKKWRAYIMLDHKQISLGLYNDKEEAHKVRLEYENKLLSDLIEKYNG